MRIINTFYHVHGVWRYTVASMAHSPYWVTVAKHAMNCLHEGSVETHYTRITCMEEENITVFYIVFYVSTVSTLHLLSYIYLL